MEIRIYHRVDVGRFREIGTRPYAAALAHAYSYDTDDPDLDKIWGDNNRHDLDGSCVVPESHRSLSVGDVIVIGEVAHQVLNCGFELLGSDTMSAAISRTLEVIHGTSIPGFAE